MDPQLKVKIGKYMSYILRHNPENLKIDKEGFVKLDALLQKIREKYDIDESLIREIVSDATSKKRFEIVDKKIRAIYGHSLKVGIIYPEDKTTSILYHGTTRSSASKILKEGLKPMKRQWIHLSLTIETALETARRKTTAPVILEIDVEKSRTNGIKFYKASDRIYLSKYIPPKYIKITSA